MRSSLAAAAALVGAATTRAAAAAASVPSVTDLLENTLENIGEEVEDLTVVASAVLNQLGDITPTATPTSIADVISIVSSVTAAQPTALLESAVELVLNGIGPGSLDDVLDQYSKGSNSENNDNPREPAAGPVYPSAGADDAPYSVDEDTLRSAIYIPETFTYGAKPPVILVPATGSKGGLVYESNLGKLLPETDYADPVWLNIPGWLLEDIAWNAEFVAYAVNYISGISSPVGQNVSVIAFSQGNIVTQWALSYWPSARALVSDYVAVSPDYHGTVLIDAVLCPEFPNLPCPPSVAQQAYTSSFIEFFRRSSDGGAGGASAFVPTTTVFSATDDVVQPQHGRNASAFLEDERGVGVVNIELQRECPLVSPGALVPGTHEGPLWGAPLQILIKDALTNEGPASIERIGRENWERECSRVSAEGLGLPDVVGTSAAVPVAFVAVFLYPHRILEEPPLPAYALQS